MAHRWITGGSQYWVTRYMQEAVSPVTTKMIWTAVQSTNNLDLIPSKRFLKLRVLQCMRAMGCIQGTYVPDPRIKKRMKNGWELVEESAFRFIKKEID